MKLEINGTIPFIHKVRAQASLPEALNDFFRGVDFNSDSGIAVSPSTALTLSAVWRAVNIIASTVATLPLGLFKHEGEGNVPVHDHEAVGLLRKPNNIGSAIILKEAVQSQVLTWGNGYAYIKRDRFANPKSIIALPSQDVDVKINGDEIFYDIANIGEGIGPDNILHIPGLSFNGVTGLSPIEYAKNSIGGGLAVQRFGNTFFANGAKQSGVLIHPGKLGDEGTKNLRKSFEKRMKDKENGTLVLEEGTKYIPITIPPDSAQFLQSKVHTVDEVARWFGVSPHLLHSKEHTAYNSNEQLGIDFVTYTLLPWIRKWEDELHRKLLKVNEMDMFFKFNVDGLLRGDNASRGQWYRTMTDIGAYSINEVRKLEDKNPIDGGDEHTIQVNKEDINKKEDEETSET